MFKPASVLWERRGKRHRRTGIIASSPRFLIARAPMRKGKALHGAAIVLLAILVGVTGCASSAEIAATATATQLACERAYQCRVVVPSCGPALTTAEGQDGIWYSGFQAPGNVAALLGFRPLLPTWIPSAVDADRVVVTGSDVLAGQPLPGRARLLHVGYVAWPEIRENPDLRRDRESMLGLDETAETTGDLGRLTTIWTGSVPYELQVVAQRATAIGAAPATIYHLAPGGSPADFVFAVALVWRAGPVTLRLLVVRGTGHVPGEVVGVHAPGGVPAGVDGGISWHPPVEVADLEALLLRVAASAAPLADCGTRG